MIVSVHEVLMGRDKQVPLDEVQLKNLCDLLARVNHLRARFGKPLYVSSGYRPRALNRAAGGAKQSAHISCQAVDFKDSNGEFAQYCLDNIALLNKLGLYLESPKYTPGWVHIQTRATRNNPFVPY